MATFNQPVLQLNDNGTSVRLLQRLLNQTNPINIVPGTLTVDGNFGQQTKAAVQSFQTSKSLTSDGIVGLNTWNQLILSIQ